MEKQNTENVRELFKELSNYQKMMNACVEIIKANRKELHDLTIKKNDVFLKICSLSGFPEPTTINSKSQCTVEHPKDVENLSTKKVKSPKQTKPSPKQTEAPKQVEPKQKKSKSKKTDKKDLDNYLLDDPLPIEEAKL